MDTSTFKPGQLACITTLDAPVAVSAGAGSGKTFTLTQRIAWALMEGSAADGGRFLDGIDEVLAITFTEKAAGEIKARVKSVLRAEGMAEEALKVDGAWISTIHGMCSRILRAHAVELGIDPAFSVLGEARAKELMDESIEEALSGANEFVVPHGADALFDEYRARSTDAFDRNSIESMLRTLVSCVSASPQGFGCFAEQAPCRPAGVLLRGLVELMEGLYEAASAQNQSERRDAWLKRADGFFAAAQEAFSAGDIDARRLADAFEACPPPNAGFGAKPYKEQAKEAQGACEALVLEAKYLIAAPVMRHLLDTARAVLAGYRRRKDELGVLDNDDLLVRAARALAEHEGIAREFADKFKLIMVDEFQDTDQLQVDMIERLAGPGACRLCTVGDAQQSIYRFRGADISVYRRRLDAVRVSNPRGMIELPDNFRSHNDILRFVDRVFEQPQVFGDEFMSLSASRGEPVKRPFLGSRRIDVLLTTRPYRGGADARTARRIEAVRIARRLAELRDAGHAPGEMTVLLGRMTNAGVYAEALRNEGFACVIAGGSVFSSAPEVRIMLRLAQVIANPHETAALFELLASEMFALSADDFLALSTREDAQRGLLVRQALDKGFVELADAQGLSPQLAHAVAIVRSMAQKAGRTPVCEIMADVVRDTGWLARLDARGAEGLSVAGNVMKAIRLIERFEAEGACGPSEVARAFAAHLAAVKEPPGALSATGGDFVSIMTVHASKGLQFPIVVVAEMEKGGISGSDRLFCEVADGRAYASLLPDRSVAQRGGLWASKPASEGYGVLPDFTDGATVDDIAHAPDALVQAAALRAYSRQQELQERRRLLYVALTRAKEAVVVAMSTVQRASGFTSGADVGVYDDIRSALFGTGDFEPGDTRVDFGGSTAALASRVDVTDEVAAEYLGGNPCSEGARLGDDSYSGGIQDASGSCEGAEGARRGIAPESERPLFLVPAVREHDAAAQTPWRLARRGVISYSAIAEGDERPPAASEGASGTYAPDDDDAFWDELCASLASDADKATDVGSAFHLLAEQAALHAKGTIEPPDSDRIDCAMRQCGLGAQHRARIEDALALWSGSDTARFMAQRPYMRPELPFFVELERGCSGGASGCSEALYLEGAIDLFACDEHCAGTAYIVDYKTGGHADEPPDALYAKHLLQASCYAFAALSQGFDAVEAAFVRVEQPDARNAGQPQTMRYRFVRDDRETLRCRIMSAYEASQGLRGQNGR